MESVFLTRASAVMELQWRPSIVVPTTPTFVASVTQDIIYPAMSAWLTAATVSTGRQLAGQLAPATTLTFVPDVTRGTISQEMTVCKIVALALTELQ